MFDAQVITKTAIWYRVSVLELPQGLSLGWHSTDKLGKIQHHSEMVSWNNVVSIRRFAD